MDKQFLIENNLMEAHKQFMRLCEFTSFHDLAEEGEEEDPNAMGDAPMDMGADPSMGQDANAAGGGDPMAGGGDPNAMGGDPMGAPNQNGMDDASMGGDPNAMGGDPMGAPDLGGMGEDPSMEEEDDVIDVDDITDAQEKMNRKINTVGKDMEGVDDKIQSLMSAIESMTSMITQNNSEIQQFKQEFERRNPTQSEKLNLRSLSSYPFNIHPDDYWKAKGVTSNYDVYSDNDKSTADEYEITNSDVDDFDEKAMQDSFYIDDDLQQDLKKIFGL